MGKIQEEFEESKKYELKTEDVEINGKTVKLVELTKDNVARVEAMIRMDSSYARTGDPTFVGSSAFWMRKLKKSYENNKCDVDGYTFSDIVLNSVMAVDTENSTHLNSDRNALNDFITDKNLIENVHAIYPDYVVHEIKKKRCYIDAYWIMKDRIVNFDNGETDKLKKSLEAGNFDLFEKLAKVTSDEITAELPETERAVSGTRCNVSFASKFCAYACYYLFKNKPEQDNFSKYDSVVMKVLPFYAKRWGIDFENYSFGEDKNADNYKRLREQGYKIISGKKNDPEVFDRICQFYQDYSAVIGKIIKKSGDQISRNGFDHLLWYYHKGHPIDD